MNEQPGDYRIVLRALPNSVPAVVRLRRALKTFLRSYALKCVRAEEIAAPDAPAVEQTG